MASLSLVFDLLARDRASAEFRKVGDAASKAGKDSEGFGNRIGGAMKFAAGAIAAAGIGRAFAGFISGAAESAKIARLTEQVIKSTGGAANITANQVSTLALAISNKTAVDDEAVQSASNLLLTFTKVRNETGKGNDIFNQATQAAIDMSVALGTDANGAALQLGKALNDPIKGVTALSRAGVSFTQQQKDQIKAMVEAGDTLGAQKIILAEMQTQFGGAAAAAADPIARLKVIAGNLGDQIGGYLLPVIDKLATFLSDRAIPALSAAAGWLVDKLGPAFKEIRGGIIAFTEAWRYNDGEITSSGLPGFMERVGYVARQTFDYVRAEVIPRLVEFGSYIKTEIVPRLVDFAAWVRRNWDILKIFLAAIAGAVIAYRIYTTTILAITKAKAAWVAIQKALNAVMKANPIGILITIIGALVAAVVVAYNSSDTFRRIVDNAFRTVAAAGKWMWENVLKPVFGLLMAYWTTVAKAIMFGWNNIIKPAWAALQATINFLWNNVLRPVFGAVGKAWSALGSGIRTVYTSVIKPVFDAFGRLVGVIRDGFRTAVATIGTIWDSLKSRLRAPVQWVVDVVWNNGLRRLWNFINNLWGGTDLAAFAFSAGGTYTGRSTRGGVQAFAGGGVLPGYTPGRDVHQFYSPTGGRLALSGGEAIMRPEFTRAVGGSAGVQFLNQLAMQEGGKALSRALTGGFDRETVKHFATGGVVSLPGWLNTALKFVPGGGFISGALSAINGGGQGGGLFGSGLASLVRTIAGKLWAKAESLFSGGSVGSGVPAGGGSLGGSWQSIWSVVKAAIPAARINSTFRPGDPGYHGRNKAIDFGYGTGPGGAGSAGLAAINRFLHDRYGSRLAELIYDGIGDDRPDIKNGRPLTYSAATRAAHRNHVHAAVYDSGGLLRPGYTLAYNGTGKNETVRTAEQEAAMSGRTVNIYTYGNEKEIVRALAAHEQRQAALAPAW